MADGTTDVAAEWEQARKARTVTVMVAIGKKLQAEGRANLASWIWDRAREVKDADYATALPIGAKVHNTILIWAESLQGDGQAQDGFENIVSGLFGIIGHKNSNDNTELVNFLCDYDDFLCACLGFDVDQAHVFGEPAEVTRVRLAMAVEKKALAARLQKQLLGGKKVG